MLITWLKRYDYYNKYSDDDSITIYVMLASMSSELQKQHNGMNAKTWLFVSKNCLINYLCERIWDFQAIILI